VLKVIVANPAMIAAYKAGVPGNGGKLVGARDQRRRLPEAQHLRSS
jgi:hypothetical protein